MPVLTAPPVVPPSSSQPLQGHLSARGGAGFATIGPKDHAALELSWRPAEHDVLDPQPGFPANAGVEMFGVRVRVDQDRIGDADMVTLERADFVKIANYVPFEEWIHKSSWRVGFGAGRMHELGCARWKCTAADFEFAYGFSVRADREAHNIFFLMAESQTWAGPALTPNYRIGAGPVAGAILQPLPFWRLTAEAALRVDALGDRGQGVWNLHAASAAPAGAPALRALSPVWRVEGATSFDVGSNTTLRVEAARLGNSRELFAGFFRYF